MVGEMPADSHWGETGQKLAGTSLPVTSRSISATFSFSRITRSVSWANLPSSYSLWVQ